MRNAYALLGLAFLVVFGGAFLIFQRAHAPGEGESNSFVMSLTLTSPVFDNNGFIPEKYTCDGDNVNPPLYISGVPEGTVSLVLVMDDPDIPQEFKNTRGIEKFDHWSLYNLPPDTAEINYETLEVSHGLNGRGADSYTGPCPPPEYEPTTHRYIFRLYALSGNLNFIKTPTLDEIETAAKGIEIESAELIGLYDRSK